MITPGEARLLYGRAFYTNPFKTAFREKMPGLMPISSVFKKYGRDIVYLCVIISMAGWIWTDARRQHTYDRMLFGDMKVIGQINERFMEGLITQIERDLDYESEKDKICRKNLVSARKEMNSFKDRVQQVMHEMSMSHSKKWTLEPQNSDDFYRAASEAELESLKLAAQGLCDSLVQYSEFDQNASQIIRTYLSGALNSDYWTLAKSAKANQSGVLLKCMALKADIALVAMLNFLATQTSRDIVETYFAPCVSAAKSAIKPGETYHADIFLSQYYNSELYKKSAVIKVNGTPCSIQDGLVHFSKRYSTPGEKKYSVEIAITNPVTRMVNTFSKEFALLVVDTCR